MNPLVGSHRLNNVSLPSTPPSKSATLEVPIAIQNKQMQAMPSLPKPPPSHSFPPLPQLPKTFTNTVEPQKVPDNAVKAGMAKVLRNSMSRFPQISARKSSRASSISKTTHIENAAVKSTEKFPTAALKEKIDNYEIVKSEEIVENEKIVKEKEFFNADEVKSNVQKYLNDSGMAILNRGTSSSKEAREKFIDHLAQCMNDHASKKYDPKVPKEARTVSMSKLLGKEGVKLYKAAIKEERNSADFRAAVFHEATKHYEGPTWEKRMILWIGGPSASGKTYAAGNMIKEIGKNEKLMPRRGAASEQGNDVVSIDGGTERQMSQMRQLVLQVALSKGYSGIEDLHDNTHLGIKSIVQKAAISQPNLSLVIPNTFARPWADHNIDILSKLEGTTQIFSEVLGAGDFEKLEHKKTTKNEPKIDSASIEKKQGTFKETVAKMGNSRAWMAEKESFTASVTMNKRDELPESKNYNPEYFSNGVKGSKRARKRAIDQNITFVGYKNELEIIGSSKVNTSVIDGFLQEEKNEGRAFLENNNQAFRDRSGFEKELAKNPSYEQKFKEYQKKHPELSLPQFLVIS